MKQEKMDIAKVLAMLAQPKEAPAPLKNVERKFLDIPYITKEKKIEKRPVHLFLPEGVKRPIPLIFIPHYEMGEDAEELRTYLKMGCAVASVTEFADKYNGQLTDDDLVFNNAALYTLRNLPEIERSKIAVVGGSAGGYMALMLSALQLGICCTIANAPITNIYFNLFRHFQEAKKLNCRVLSQLPEAPAGLDDSKTDRGSLFDVMKDLVNAPLPFIAAISDLFMPILNNFPDHNDVARWEAFSPVALTDLFCNPIMINHFLSDVLVPVDQISRRYTYDKLGNSFKEFYDLRLPKDLPGKLGYTLEERLPKIKTRIERISFVDANADSILPFDAGKRFNLNIYDDGPPESYSSHRVTMGNGKADDTKYLECMFSETSAKINILTPEKLRSFLERYMGRCVQLPAHTDVDNQIYGSLEIYRSEVCEELADWKKTNGETALNKVYEAMLESESDVNCRTDLQKSMDYINKLI